MALINSSSAITAKVRSRYGRRLRYKDYQAMAKCESVGDVVRYLKTYTHFQDYLDKVSNDIHRGNLENILHERQFERFLTLCKYNSGNSPVTSYIIRRSEINQLMKFITLLSINRPQEYLFSLPMRPTTARSSNSSLRTARAITTLPLLKKRWMSTISSSCTRI